MRAGDAQVFGKTIQATGLNPEAVGIFNLDWVDGSDAVLGDARRRTARSSTRTTRRTTT